MGDSQKHYANEITQTHKTASSMIPFIRLSGKRKTRETEIRSILARSWGREKVIERGMRELYKVTIIFYILMVVELTQLYLPKFIGLYT